MRCGSTTRRPAATRILGTNELPLDGRWHTIAIDLAARGAGECTFIPHGGPGDGDGGVDRVCFDAVYRIARRGWGDRYSAGSWRAAEGDAARSRERNCKLSAPHPDWLEARAAAFSGRGGKGGQRFFRSSRRIGG